MPYRLKGLASLLTLLLPVASLAGTQQVSPSTSKLTATAGEFFEFSLSYTADSEQLPGVGVKLFFDSSKLDFKSIRAVYQTGLLGVDSQPKSDTKNLDGDAATDRVINAGWASFQGNWPGDGATPISLYTAGFTTASSFTGATRINLTGDAAANSDLQLGTVQITSKAGGASQPDTAGGGNTAGGNTNNDSGAGSSNGGKDVGNTASGDDNSGNIDSPRPESSAGRDSNSAEDTAVQGDGGTASNEDSTSKKGGSGSLSLVTLLFGGLFLLIHLRLRRVSR